MGCRLPSCGSGGMVHVLNQNWKNKVIPNCRPFLKSLLGKVSSRLFDFHQCCPNRITFTLE